MFCCPPPKDFTSKMTSTCWVSCMKTTQRLLHTFGVELCFSSVLLTRTLTQKINKLQSQCFVYKFVYSCLALQCFCVPTRTFNPGFVVGRWTDNIEWPSTDNWTTMSLGRPELQCALLQLPGHGRRDLRDLSGSVKTYDDSFTLLGFASFKDVFACN